jgi:hypothetical protein
METGESLKKEVELCWLLQVPMGYATTLIKDSADSGVCVLGGIFLRFRHDFSFFVFKAFLCPRIMARRSSTESSLLCRVIFDCFEKPIVFWSTGEVENVAGRR